MEFGIATPDGTDEEADDEAAAAERPSGVTLQPTAPTEDAPMNDDDLDNDEQSMLPWWHAGQEPAVAYHANARLADGRTSIIVDTGACRNLSCQIWTQDAAAQCQRHGFQVQQRKLFKPLSVQGVGN